MALLIDLGIGEGVRIDATDIWLLKAIHDDGTAAFFDPAGAEVVLQQEASLRVAPGLRLSISPSQEPGRLRLVLDAYIPLIHRYPPRTGPAPQRLPATREGRV